MNRKQLEKELDELKEKSKKRDERIANTKDFFIWFFTIIFAVGEPLLFCLVGYFEKNDNLLLGGIIFFSVILFLFISFLYIVAHCVDKNKEK